MEAVCILKQERVDWDSAKRVLGDSNFLRSLEEFDRDNIPVGWSWGCLCRGGRDEEVNILYAIESIAPHYTAYSRPSSRATLLHAPTPAAPPLAGAAG